MWTIAGTINALTANQQQQQKLTQIWRYYRIYKYMVNVRFLCWAARLVACAEEMIWGDNGRKLVQSMRWRDPKWTSSLRVILDLKNGFDFYVYLKSVYHVPISTFWGRKTTRNKKKSVAPLNIMQAYNYSCIEDTNLKLVLKIMVEF